jgi:hypothetical protein
MGNRRLYKIEFLHRLGTLGSERLKVTALNLFHPTAPPPFQKVGLSYCDTVSAGREITPPLSRGRRRRGMGYYERSMRNSNVFVKRLLRLN